MTAQPPGHIRVTDDRADVRGTAVRVVFGALRRLDRWPTVGDAFLHAAAAEGASTSVWPLINAAMRAAADQDPDSIARLPYDQQVQVLRATGEHLTNQIERDNRGGAL